VIFVEESVGSGEVISKFVQTLKVQGNFPIQRLRIPPKDQGESLLEGPGWQL
jgi:hypothetical protein